MFLNSPYIITTLTKFPFPFIGCGPHILKTMTIVFTTSLCQFDVVVPNLGPRTLMINVPGPVQRIVERSMSQK